MNTWRHDANWLLHHLPLCLFLWKGIINFSYAKNGFITMLKKMYCCKWEPELCFHSITWEVPASWSKFYWLQADQRDICHVSLFITTSTGTSAIVQLLYFTNSQTYQVSRENIHCTVFCFQGVNLFYAKWKQKLYPLEKPLWILN